MIRSLSFKRAATAAFVTLSVALTPVLSAAQSLSDALVHAYDNSNLLEQQRFLLQATDENVAQAQSAFRPTVTFLAGINQTGVNGTNDLFSTSVALEAQWLLLDGGSRSARLQARKALVLAGRNGLVQAEQQVLLQAVTAFMELRRDIQLVALRENNLRVITSQLRAAEDRFEVGEVTRTDVEIARARLAAARSGLVAAQGQVEVGREVYRLAVGRDPQALASPPRAPQLPATEDAARAVALRTHPSIAQLQQTVVANEFLATAADQDRLGTLSATASVGTGTRNDTESTNAAVGLRFSQPLYTGGRLSSVARQAVANLNAVRAQLAQQGAVVSEGVGRTWALLRVAQAQVSSGQQQVRAAQLAFDGVREEASLGARTTLDVLNAEQELQDARNAALSAQTDAYLAVYSVLASMGLLTTDHLGLAVQKYDVTAYSNAVSTAPAISSEYGTRLDRVLRRKAGGGN
jgi:outer membrane protein